MNQYTTTTGTSTTISISPQSYYTYSNSTDLCQSISSWASASGQTLKFQNGTVTLTKAEEKNKIPEIIKVEVLCPNKVMRFTFDDKTKIKTICLEEDTFDFRFAFFIAYAKKDYAKKYFPAGIFKMAEDLSYQKEYNKKVDKAIKMYEKELKEKQKEEEAKAEAKRIEKNRLEKRRKKKEKAKLARINEITEAIKKSREISNLI